MITKLDLAVGAQLETTQHIIRLKMIQISKGQC